MKAKGICAQCGAPLPADVAEAICPQCELRGALNLGGDLADEFSTPDAAATPATIGDYELLEELGRGGMGVVFKARQRSLDRMVALKLLPAGALARPEAVKRFQAEASAAAALQHPNIVAIHEIGVQDDQHFIAMDLVDGSPLSRVVASGPLPPRRAAAYVKAIAEAVHYAHERGILHRDLKPSNVLLGADDQPRVTDFGLAKRLPSKSEIENPKSEIELTLSGQLLGSPNYMPPEQTAARGKVSRRSDVYGLGATLYHLLTGRAPFQASTITEVLQQVAQADPPAPRLLNPAIPRDLETICLKCLEKEPPKRYATAQALADELNRFLRDEPIHARPVGRLEKSWRWCRRKPALASFVAATALLLLAILIGSPIAVYRINQARKAEQVQLKRTKEESLKARQFSYASDMNLAQQAVQEDDFSRALQLLERHRPAANPLRSSRREEALTSSKFRVPSSELEVSLLTDLRGWEWRYWWRQCQGEERFILGEHTNGATAVGLLADGRTVFSAGRDKCVRLWDLEPRRQIGLLPHHAEVVGAAASPDGRWLATAASKDYTDNRLLLWDLATQKIAATLTTNFHLRGGSITFSPDNKWLAFATVFGGVRIWDVDARSEVTHLPSIRPATFGIAFSPDSRTLAYNENEYGAILLWDIASRSGIGRLTGHQSVVMALAFTPDGQTLASGSQDRSARLWNLAERREGFAFTNHSGGFTTLAFSPDGRTLATSGEGGAGRVIRLVDVKTGKQKAELRGHRKNISSLAFTPDGQTLLSASDDGTIRIWNPVPRAKEKSAHPVAPDLSTDWSTYGPALCLSPDGRHLLTVYTNQTFTVCDTLRLAEGERHPLPFTNTTIAAVAPGGRLAAFASGRGEVMLWDAETAQARFFAQPVTNRIHRLVFSLDGRYLAVANDTRPFSLDGHYLAGAYNPRTVRVWDVGARKETHVFSAESRLPVSLTFSADARALMAGSGSGSVKLWPLDGPGEAATFPGHSGWVNGLATLPDGQTLVSAGGDIRFWDVRTRRETDKLNPRAGAYHCLALSPDGRRLAAGANDGRITIWDIASHQEVATIEGHQESVRHLAFTPDGDHLVSVSKDQLRVWHAPSWAEIDAPEME